MNVMSPGSVREALDLLASDGAAVPIAGGTDLLVHWPVRVEAHERTYVDLSRLDSLRPLRWTADELLLGGLTTYWDVIRADRASQEFPLLVDAARQVGAIQIQARGTWAGNIVNASPAADGVPVLMAYHAVVVLASRRGREGGGLASTRSGAGWRVVAASVAPTIRRCPAVERLLETGTPIASPEALRPAIAQDVAPIDDIRSSAQYRTHVMAQVLYHDLRDFWGKRA